MRRLLLLTILILGVTSVHAQDDVQGHVIDDWHALLEFYGEQRDRLQADGKVVVEGPRAEFYDPAAVEDDEDASSFEVDLEAGVTYTMMMSCARDSGLDPDAAVLDPDGNEIAIADGTSIAEVFSFTPEVAGPHRIEVDVFGCEADRCAYGFIISRS